MIKEIRTDNAPPALGPYSQAIQAGDFIFVSGQIGVKPNGEVAEGSEGQTHQVLKNLQEILKEAGADFSDVVKFTIFLSSMDDFETVNEIYASYVKKPYPARATVEVARLPKDLLVEMEAIVYKKSE